jgi:hypothetical protein
MGVCSDSGLLLNDLSTDKMDAVRDEWTNASQGKPKHSKNLTATLSILHRMTLIELKKPRVVT